MGDQNLEHLRWLLDRQLSWISTADSKLAILGPLPLALLAFSLIEFDLAFASITWVDLPVLLSTTLLLLSLFFSALALIPRISGPEKSNIFFGTIANRTVVEFDTSLNDEEYISLRRDLILQIHVNAEIAYVKHKNTSKSVLCLISALPVWLIAVAKVQSIGTI